MNPPERKPSALGYALLTYMTLVIAAITLIPFEFKLRQHVAFSLRGSLSDVFENIVLFLPLGFLFHLYRRQTGWRSVLQALCFGTLVSAALETGQLFLPARFPSVLDVAANGLGAGLGACAAAFQHPQARPERMSALFALEMPLMNVVYLLIPLLWLGSLSMDGEVHRLALMLVLGLFGGSVLASVYTSRRPPDRRRGDFLPAFYASGWFLLGTLPALASFPLEVLAVSAAVGGAAQLSTRLFRHRNEAERRFELTTLARVLPLYGLFLLLLSVWPSTLPLGEWSRGLDYKRLTEMERIVFAARFIEAIAAFTLLGYMVAEMRGRRSESAVKTLTWVTGASLGFSILTAAVRDFLAGPLSSVLEAALFTTAALYGAIIYRLQLAAIQRLQTRGPR
ncbi:MAG: VanZ family protein [Hyphomicrobiales bacterium]